LRGDTHGGCGETDREQSQHRAPGRLNRACRPLRLRLLAAIDEVGQAQEIGARDGGEVIQGGRRAGRGPLAQPEG
jgi:hypothetical protein